MDYPEFGSKRELNKVSKVALPESLLMFTEAQKYFPMPQSLSSQALKPERGCVTCSVLLRDSLQVMDAQLHTIGVGIHPPESLSSILRNCIKVGNHQLQQCGLCRNLLLLLKKKKKGEFFLQFPFVKNMQAPH